MAASAEPVSIGREICCSSPPNQKYGAEVTMELAKTGGEEMAAGVATEVVGVMRMWQRVNNVLE